MGLFSGKSGILGVAGKFLFGSSDTSGLDAQQTAILKKQVTEWEQKLKDLPAEKKQALDQINTAYDKYALMLEEAKATGDTQAQELYNNQLSMVNDFLKSEVGLSEEMLNERDIMLSEQKKIEYDLVKGDVTKYRELQKEYEDTTDKALSIVDTNLKVTDETLDKLITTGVPEGSAGLRSRLIEQYGDIKTGLQRQEAGRGRTGTTAKELTLDIAKTKALGDQALSQQTAGRQQIQDLLNTRGQTANQLTSIGANRLANLEDTGGRALAAVESKYNAQELASLNQQQLQEMSLTAQTDAQKLALNRELAERNMMAEQNLTKDQATAMFNQLNATQQQQQLFRAEEKSLLANKQIAEKGVVADLEKQAQAERDAQSSTLNQIMGVAKTAASFYTGGLSDGGFSAVEGLKNMVGIKSPSAIPTSLPGTAVSDLPDLQRPVSFNPTTSFFGASSTKNKNVNNTLGNIETYRGNGTWQ